jgi:hypothetical protein
VISASFCADLSFVRCSAKILHKSLRAVSPWRLGWLDAGCIGEGSMT